MVDIIKNKYLENESDEYVLNVGNEKIQINITLNEDKNKTGQVKGTVQDDNGNLLKGVEAELISRDENLFLTSQSDENGEFYFNNIPENKICKIFLSMSNKETYESTWFKVVEFFEYKELNFTLLDQETYSIIIGTLESSSNPIEKIEVALFSVDSSNNLTLLSVVRSNEEGEFSISNVEQGNYVLTVENDEITNVSTNVNINQNSQIIQVKLNI